MYTNPYSKYAEGKGRWLKANFHTHAGTGKGTCGHYEIDEVISAYRDCGCEVLSISNHELYSDVSEYQEKYDILLLNAFEYSTDPHMLCIDVKSHIKGSHQEAIKTTLEQGGFVILCHPNWIRKEYWPWKDIDALTGYTGIEIFNGVIPRLSGSGLATDTWDYLLSQGKLVWGFGNDDFHRWHDLSNVWTSIFAEKNRMDVRQSIDAGCFYVSTGLILNEFTFENGAITVAASARGRYVKDYKYVFIGKGGEILSEQFGEKVQYQLKGNELYVRVQVINEHGAMLWTQPVYRTESFSRP